MALDTYDVPLGNIIIVNATLQLLNIAKRLVAKSISFFAWESKKRGYTTRWCSALRDVQNTNANFHPQHPIVCRSPRPATNTYRFMYLCIYLWVVTNTRCSSVLPATPVFQDRNSPLFCPGGGAHTCPLVIIVFSLAYVCRNGSWWPCRCVCLCL